MRIATCAGVAGKVPDPPYRASLSREVRPLEPGSYRGHASVDNELGAGHELRCVRQQKGTKLGDLGHPAEAAHRDITDHAGPCGVRKLSLRRYLLDHRALQE